MSLEFFIAGRYLKAKRKEGFISLISFFSIAGVAVGVMALVVVIAVMSGSETDFRKRILGVEPHILVMNGSGQFYNYKMVQKKIEHIKGVKAVSPMVFAQTMIRTSHALSGAVVRGIEPENSFSLIRGFTVNELKKELVTGRKKGELPGIILGKELAHNLGVGIGAKIVLMSPNGMISPIGHIPAMQRFSVTGIFESGMYEYDSSLAYVHLNEAQELMGMHGRVSALGVWVNDIFAAGNVKKSILSILKYPFYARDWMEINKSLFSALKLEKTAMFVILSLIILVAAFNITSALTMMVMEKTRDIAVLKAMGATNRMIKKIFIIQGVVIGFLGTCVGTVSGIAVCLVLQKYKFIKLPAAYPFSTLPVQLEFTDVFFISLAAIILCFLATIYPSCKASATNPVEALRYG